MDGLQFMYIKKFLRKTEPNCVSYQCAAVECGLGKMTITVVAVYRPPGSDIKLFLTKMELMLSRLFSENKTIFIVGDFNIELLRENKTGTEFIAMVNSFNFSPTVNTRVTCSSASCIDNIYTNSQSLINQSIKKVALLSEK